MKSAFDAFSISSSPNPPKRYIWDAGLVSAILAFAE
jgi:hypothetical protein